MSILHLLLGTWLFMFSTLIGVAIYQVGKYRRERAWNNHCIQAISLAMRGDKDVPRHTV